MHYLSALTASLLLLITALYSHQPLASSADFDGQKFIETASIRSISEIETAKIALQKSSSAEVHSYAQSVIAENIATLAALSTLAQSAKLNMFSDAELQAKARKYVFERKGKTFDTAYADMRAAERRKMVNLFRAAINSDELLFKRYAEAALPGLMRQLYMAQQLVEQLDLASTMVASRL